MGPAAPGSSIGFETNIPSQKALRDVAAERSRMIKEVFSPASVIIFGTGQGPLIEGLRNAGLEAWGAFRSEAEIRKLDRDTRPFCFVDAGPESTAGTPGFRFDLAIGNGPRTPLPVEEAKRAIASLARVSDTILFSPEGVFPQHHDKEKPKTPTECWISLFETFGYALDVFFDTSLLSFGGLLFRKREYLDFPFSRPIRLCILSSVADNACSAVRLRSPLAYLEKEGRVEIRFFPADKKHPPGTEHVDWADMLILQRIKSYRWRSYLKHAAGRGIPVVYEMDDNLLEMPRDHPESKSRAVSKLNRAKFSWFLKRADAVTVSTRPLAEYLRSFNENVFVLRNYVDSPYHGEELPGPEEAMRDRPEWLTLGFAGTPSHAPDLQPILKTLQLVHSRQRGRIRFVFIGYTPPSFAGQPDVISEKVVLPYPSYLRTLVRSGIDVAFAPLNRNFFNECKSNIKCLEYSLAGITGVYSGVEPYRETIIHGTTGFLVEKNTEAAWLQTLAELLDRRELIQETGIRSRQMVCDLFLTRDHYREWWDTYVSLLLRGRKGLQSS